MACALASDSLQTRSRGSFTLAKFDQISGDLAIDYQLYYLLEIGEDVPPFDG